MGPLVAWKSETERLVDDVIQGRKTPREAAENSCWKTKFNRKPADYAKIAASEDVFVQADQAIISDKAAVDLLKEIWDRNY